MSLSTEIRSNKIEVRDPYFRIAIFHDNTQRLDKTIRSELRLRICETWTIKVVTTFFRSFVLFSLLFLLIKRINQTCICELSSQTISFWFCVTLLGTVSWHYLLISVTICPALLSFRCSSTGKPASLFLCEWLAGRDRQSKGLDKEWGQNECECFFVSISMWLRWIAGGEVESRARTFTVLSACGFSGGIQN